MFLILQHTPTLRVPVVIAILFIYSRVHTGPILMCNFLMFSEQLHLGPFHPSEWNKREKNPLPLLSFHLLFSLLSTFGIKPHHYAELFVSTFVF